ncbi:MAG: GMC family oxidoreductase [Planctomycetes bacterium]|nr:GMC family oxidoreductase [Planctomycetota bacterium]
MIHDLAQTQLAELPGYDLCVIGSGPAGATIAAELANSGLRVCVLESGRAAVTPLGDRLRRVESEGLRIKSWSRERVLGGASTTWAGLSSPLEEIDLAPRAWVPLSGWPIARAQLDRYYAQAAARYRFPEAAAFGVEGFGALRAKGERQPEWNGIEEKVFLAATPPQDFGKEQRAVFEREGTDLYLDASVVRLEAERSNGRVARAHVRTSGGRTLVLEARAFVLATGGIENARLLLVSRDTCEAGLGNEHDQVGRYLMNHPKSYHGVLTLERSVTELPFFFGCMWRGFAGYAGLRLCDAEQERAGLLDSYCRFEPLFPWSDSIGVESLVTLAKRSRLVASRLRHKAQKEVVALRDYSETGDDSELQNERRGPAGWMSLGWNVVRDMPRVSRYAWNRVFERARPAVHAVRLRNFMEMQPHPENRVQLSTRQDEFGVPVPLVRHQCTELDRRSLVALHEKLATELPRAGFGRLESQLGSVQPWPIDQDASHHMGTTRMGTDPANSVVDPDGRVHSLENLYIAGASVFPTSGSANPTYTIVALSIRLAEHLRGELGSAQGAPRA